MTMGNTNRIKAHVVEPVLQAHFHLVVGLITLAGRREISSKTQGKSWMWLVEALELD